MRHYGTALHTKAKGVPRLSAVCSPGNESQWIVGCICSDLAEMAFFARERRGLGPEFRVLVEEKQMSPRAVDLPGVRPFAGWPGDSAKSGDQDLHLGPRDVPGVVSGF